MPTDFDPSAVQLSLILTAAGATVAAGLITGLIELLKRLGGLGVWVGSNATTVAFVLSAALVALAYYDSIQTGVAQVSVASGFAAFLAWYGIASISTKTYDVARNVVNRQS